MQRKAPFQKWHLKLFGFIATCAAVIGMTFWISPLVGLYHWSQPQIEDHRSIKATRELAVPRPERSISTANRKLEKLKLSAKRTESKSSLSNELTENLTAPITYCDLVRESQITLSGVVQIQPRQRSDGGWTLLVRSSDCPAELHSLVDTDSLGRIQSETDCHSTDLTELALKSETQFTIKTVTGKPGQRPLALSGPGRILVSCPGQGLSMTREAQFRERDGMLVNREGCVAWSLRNGGRALHFSSTETLDERGCGAESGECLSLVQPQSESLKNPRSSFQFQNQNTMRILEEKSIEPAQNTLVQSNAQEDLDSPERSLTGAIAWTRVPYELQGCDQVSAR